MILRKFSISGCSITDLFLNCRAFARNVDILDCIFQEVDNHASWRNLVEIKLRMLSVSDQEFTLNFLTKDLCSNLT